jgi:hypothetical protein
VSWAADTCQAVFLFRVAVGDAEDARTAQLNGTTVSSRARHVNIVGRSRQHRGRVAEILVPEIRILVERSGLVGNTRHQGDPHRAIRIPDTHMSAHHTRREAPADRDNVPLTVFVASLRRRNTCYG